MRKYGRTTMSLNPARRAFLIGGSCLSWMFALTRNSEATFGANESQRDGSDLPSGTDLTHADLGSNFKFVQEIASHRGNSWLDFENQAAMSDTFVRMAREKVTEILRYSPPRVAFDPQVMERVDCGEYWRERVELSTTPWFRIPVYVLVPKNIDRPTAAIVDLHSHGGMFLFGKEKVIDFGHNHPAMNTYHQKNYGGRPTATALAKRGYVVITSDAFMFGERRVLMDEDRKFGWDRSQYSLDDVQVLNAKCRTKESTLAKSLVLAGTTWPGIVNYDDRQLVEYLTTRPEVDADRIGCVGISMGGYRSVFLAAMEPRIRAACVVGFMSTTSGMIQAHVDTHSWIHFLPGLHTLMDWPELVSLTAPRALMVQQCLQDQLFPLTGMQASVRRIGQLYERAGCSQQFSGRFYDEPHQWTVSMQEEAFEWLDSKLGHRS